MPAVLQYDTDTTGRNTLAQATDNTPRHKNVLHASSWEVRLLWRQSEVNAQLSAKDWQLSGCSAEETVASCRFAVNSRIAFERWG